MTMKRLVAAHAVLLPAFDTTTLSDGVKRFLEQGGCSILPGESRAEYVARRMTVERIATETTDTFLRLSEEALSRTDYLLVAVDQEIGGICRLHDLVPQFPATEMLTTVETAAFEKISESIALAATQMGVNCFLAPILDVVTGQNPWLHHRTWTTDPAEMSRLSSAYIRAVQSSGVAATAKHFPGFHNMPLDPAVEAAAIQDASAASYEPGYIPWRDAIANEVEMIMVGPAIVTAFDAEKPASLSPVIMTMLRQNFGFNGVIMADDLDAKATLRGRSVPQVAVDALIAGADYLLLADSGDQLERVVQAIVDAVEQGVLSEDRLFDAASRVIALAKKYNV